MELGFGLPLFGAWATPHVIATVARRAEELGYASLWTGQRLLYAHEPRDEYYGDPGPQWPEYFRSVADPIVALAWTAACTERIRLGTAVLNVPFTNPVLLANQLTTLDIVSGGRLDVGVGLGWSRDEYTATGAAWSRRGARLDEFLDVLVAAWTQGTVEHDGEFFTVPRSSIAPHPVQDPHPPLYIGGASDAALRRAARIGQGFVTGNLALDAVARLGERLAGFADEAGRGPLRLVGRGSTRITAADPDPGRALLQGSFEQVVSDVARYADSGFDELFLDLNMSPDIGAPDADPARCLDVALELLERAAPVPSDPDRRSADAVRS